MATGRPRVFTIPPAAPFLPTLIGALRDGTLLPGFPAGDGPLALAAATIYLPTQRAVRAARLAFLDALGDAAMLPRLAPLGDIDEDELIFAAARSDRALEIAPALGALERRLVLAQLVQRWSRAADLRGIDSTPLVARTPAAALALADALARLMDDMITRGVPWSNLDTLVPDHLDKYWQLTLDFLRIARDVWPDYLAAAGTIEPAARRDALIAAEAARLAANPDAPVIAAGSTASMPATAQLLSTIARLPHGAVVLPGLDTHLDEPSWQLIGGARDAATGRARNPAVTHPQFAMHAFLSGLAMHREEVVTLGDIDDARTALVSEAMRPAATSEQWHTVRPSPAALGGITVIEAAHAEEEAQAIAVVLREAVEHRKSAALVTPDRALARRVAVALQRWSVSVDDTAGDALVDTPAGVFARLAVTVATDGYPPIDLLALAKHPMLRLGARAGRNTRAVAVLERAVLRGPRPRAGSAGIAAALTSFRAARADLYRTDPRKTIGESDLDAAAAFVETLSAALTPLEQVRAQAPLAHFAALHRDAILALTAGDDADDPLRGRDGEALLAALDEIAESDAAARTTVSRRDYREVFEATIAGAVVRHAANPDADVRIFGLLEARLQHADRLVLGGLVETVWPPQTRSDPWLSRPMRQELGLDLPERRIGLTAHDFAQALGAREVFITRAAKVGGAPTVASRFVQRLAAVAGVESWKEALRLGDRYVALARTLDHAPREPRLEAPAPCPPLSVRPRQLSVTEIEHWLRDPYTIYAKHILGLVPLDAVDTPPGARDRGTAIHAAVGDFTAQFAAALPDDPLAALRALGETHFAALRDYPEARAFWWPRFERIARWFAGFEIARRNDIATVHAEIRGRVELPMGTEAFTLTGRADRIEIGTDGRATIVDYKTGRAPTSTQVQSGISPQLTLEAGMLRRGGFEGVAAGLSVAGLLYVQLRGGEPPGALCPVEFRDNATFDDEAEKAIAQLAKLVAAFADDAMPYRSLVRPQWSKQYGDYDHLARVREWSAVGGMDEPGASG